MTETEGADFLRGYDAIAEFVGVTRRQAEYMATTHGLPTFKLGRVVCARRTKVREWLDRKEAAA